MGGITNKDGTAPDICGQRILIAKLPEIDLLIGQPNRNVKVSTPSLHSLVDNLSTHRRTSWVHLGKSPKQSSISCTSPVALQDSVVLDLRLSSSTIATTLSSSKSRQGYMTTDRSDESKEKTTSKHAGLVLSMTEI